MHLTANGVDVTSEQSKAFSDLVDQNERLLEQFDPDGLTRDENIEIGSISPLASSQLLPSWFVVYRLDSTGAATELEVYQLRSHAAARAHTRGDRLGVIANDMWSIIPLD